MSRIYRFQTGDLYSNCTFIIGSSYTRRNKIIIHNISTGIKLLNNTSWTKLMYGFYYFCCHRQLPATKCHLSISIVIFENKIQITNFQYGKATFFSLNIFWTFSKCIIYINKRTLIYSIMFVVFPSSTVKLLWLVWSGSICWVICYYILW